MRDDSTTISLQRYLDSLAGTDGGAPAEAVVRDLLARAVSRLQILCHSLLHRSYPRLMQGPVNLSSEEMLSSVVGRMIKALRQIKPASVRQFFALANQHMRWELNDVARRLDGYSVTELDDSIRALPEQADGVEPSTALLLRILAAIDALPEDVREAFNLTRIQGLTQMEAALVAECSERTLQRRLNHSLVLLTQSLGDLRSPPGPRRKAAGAAGQSVREIAERPRQCELLADPVG